MSTNKFMLINKTILNNVVLTEILNFSDGTNDIDIEKYVKNGHLSAILQNRNKEIPLWSLYYSCMFGYLNIIKWLYYNKRLPTINRSLSTTANEDLFIGTIKSSLAVAARCNRLDIIIWFHNNTNVEFTNNVMDYAASRGNLSIVKWLFNNRTEGCTDNAFFWSVSYGHLHVIKYLTDNIDIDIDIYPILLITAKQKHYIEIADFIEEYLTKSVR